MRTILLVISCISLLAIASAIQIPTSVEVPEKIPFDKLKAEGIGLWGTDKAGAWSHLIDFDPKERIKLVAQTDGILNLTLIEIISEFNQPVREIAMPLGVQPAGFHDLEIDLDQTDFVGFIYFTLIGIGSTGYEIEGSGTVTYATMGKVYVKAPGIG